MAENRRLRAAVRAYRDEAQPHIDKYREENARLKRVIKALSETATRIEKRVTELEAEAKQRGETSLIMRLTVAALCAAAGGSVFCDELLLRNLCQLDFDFKCAESDTGVAWTLVVAPPKDPAARLAYDNFLRLIAANQGKQ